jgi:hypothetical protein
MKYYTLDVLERAYRRQYPDLSEIEIKEKAKQLHKELNTLEIRWKRSNKRFYQKNELI